ncbi:MAG: LamG domain-containing protein [Verrucomicrobia bacterium]|nr:LamG domain-containing protein [Verrucomicrobiota bacterium]
MKTPHCLAVAFLLLSSLLFAAQDRDLRSLREALTHHASFDSGLDADFSRGDRTMYFAGTPKGATPGPGEAIRVVPGAGRFGGALHVTKKNPIRPYFRAPGMIDYQAANWSGSVSVWLKLTPDEDLEPGYCDPVQIVGGDSKKGFIFLEWSKDENPRLFRYAIRPLFEIWNPKNQDWAKMTDAERPMVQVARAPFARTKWTHVVFTFDRLNAGKAGVGRLYLDGQLQGSIQDWDLTFGWEAAKVQLVLAAAYVGHMDDLAVFNRALTAAEVGQLLRLPNGVRDLR